MSEWRAEGKAVVFANRPQFKRAECASVADAQLMAAAPDLLEAAKALVEPAGEIAYRERWMALKAAIAKAEGR